MRQSTLDDAVKLIQFAYPQIYYACHTRRRRAKSSALGMLTAGERARAADGLALLARACRKPTT